MKISILLFFFILFTDCLIGQECKYYNKENIDDISGLPIKIQKETQISQPGHTDINLFFSTNRCWIHLNLLITRGGYAKEIEFHSKTPLIITFEDLSVITLYPSHEYSGGQGDIYFLGMGLLTSTQTDNVQYSISSEQLQLLSTKPVERMTYHYSRINFGAPITDSTQLKILSKEIEPSKNVKEKIQFLTSCILQESMLQQEECIKNLQSQQLKKSFKSEDELLLEKIQSGVHLEEIKVSGQEDMNIGDVVKYHTLYGDEVYGIVIEKVGNSKLQIKSYLSPGNSTIIIENIKNIIKIKY